jgi:hypothetical protein
LQIKVEQKACVGVVQTSKIIEKKGTGRLYFLGSPILALSGKLVLVGWC